MKAVPAATEGSMKSAKLLRRISQAVFLLLFLVLFVLTQNPGHDRIQYTAKIFFNLDPLIAITAFLSSHTIEKALLFSAIVVVMTAIFGRVFCGWFCPLGTLNALASRMGRKERPLPLWISKIKYIILFFILAGAVFSFNWAGFLDPFSILIRSLTVSIYPFFSFVLMQLMDFTGYLGIAWLNEATLNVYRSLQGNMLPYNQPYFYQSAFIGIIFVTILLLNLASRRFWCRVICPLGALLGILSRFSPLGIKVKESCVSCGACKTTCPSGAISADGSARNKAECIACMNCAEPCPKDAVSYSFTFKSEPINVAKRSMVASFAAGILTVPLMRLFPNLPNAVLIRPPGSIREDQFLRCCIKCGNCMKVCPTNGLQPTFLEAGLEGMWTPRLVPRIGPCEYFCTLCGQVCPTGAIESIDRTRKTETKIGQAYIDRSRCLPWAFSTPCLVCEEMCPVPGKAIHVESFSDTDINGNQIRLGRPHIDLYSCTGCGKCEYACPVADRPAVYVTSLNESR